MLMMMMIVREKVRSERKGISGLMFMLWYFFPASMNVSTPFHLFHSISLNCIISYHISASCCAWFGLLLLSVFFFLFSVQWTVRDVTTGKPNEGEKEWWGSEYWKCTQNRQSFCCWTCIKWYYRYHVMSVDAKQSKGRWIVGVDERNQPWMMSWEKKDEEERREKEKRKRRIEEVSGGKVSHDISLEMRVISYSCGLWYFEYQQKKPQPQQQQLRSFTCISVTGTNRFSIRRHDGSTFWWWSYSSLFSSYKSNTKSFTASLTSTSGLIHD